MPRFYSPRSYSRWTPRRYISTRRTGYRSKKLAAQIDRQLVAKAENKYNLYPLTTFVSSSGIGNTWTEASTDFVQGAGLAQRIGNKISITELSFAGMLCGGQSNLALDDNRNWFRLVLGIWKNPSVGASSSHTPLYSNSVPSSMPLDKSTAPTLIYKVFDKSIPLNSPGRDSTGYMPAQKFVSCTYKFRRPVVITWDVNGVPDKQIFMSAVSDSSAAPSPGFVSGYLKVAWIDI